MQSSPSRWMQLLLAFKPDVMLLRAHLLPQEAALSSSMHDKASVPL